MKIIITGATGSLGAHLTRHFSSKGDDVITVGRTATPPAKLLACSTYIQADISKKFELPEADICIHAAALASDRSSAQDLMLANVHGTENVARAAKHCGKFIHVSSSSVYIPNGQPLTEDMRADAHDRRLTDYGRSKILAEQAAIQHFTQGSCYILRPRALYGPGDKVLLPRILGLYRKNKMIRPGSMNVQLSLTHYDNFAQAVELCMADHTSKVHIYNVADLKAQTLYDIVKKLLVMVHSKAIPEKKIPLQLVKLFSLFGLGNISPIMLNTLTNDMVLDSTKIRQELHYAPTRDFDNSVAEVVEWIVKAGGAYEVKRGSTALSWI